MSQPNQKSAANVPVTPATSPKTFEENVAILAKQPKMDNPYTNGPAGESTFNAKARLRLAHRFESEREKQENADKKAVGVSGGYNRVPSIVDGLRDQIRKSGDVPFTEDRIAVLAEARYQENNPDRKKSKDGSKIYTQAILDAYRLGGSLTFNPKEKTFSMTPAFKTFLMTPASQK